MNVIQSIVDQYHRKLNILMYAFSDDVYDYLKYIKFYNNINNISIIVSSYFELRKLEVKFNNIKKLIGIRNFNNINIFLNSNIPIKKYDIFVLNNLDGEKQSIINNLNIKYLIFEFNVKLFKIKNYKQIDKNIYELENSKLENSELKNFKLKIDDKEENDENNIINSIKTNNQKNTSTSNIVPLNSSIICKNINDNRDNLIKIIKFNKNKKPLISIIVPTYNQSNFTVKCFNSIDKYYNNNYKINIIWVDNGSNKDNIDEVENCIKKLKNIKVYSIKSLSILGYVKATNIGIKKALKLNSDYIILQNNDTEVTNNWLEPMINVLENDISIVGAGPITNSKIAVQGVDHVKNTFIKNLSDKNIEQTNKFAEYLHNIFKDAYIVLSQNNKIFTPAFFCTVFKSSIFKEIGYLDEAFGMGYGDDIDYCNRVFLAGHNMAFVPESYVLHNHRTTFKSLYDEEKIKTTIQARLFQCDLRANLNKNKNKKCVIYTCITDNYDSLKTYNTFDTKNCDYICFVDRPPKFKIPDQWIVRNVSSFSKFLGYNKNNDCTRLSRFFKTHPHLFFINYEYSIWVDGNINMLKSPLELIDLLPYSEFLLSGEHPKRDCIYDEIEECKKLKKDDVNKLDEMYNILKNDSYPHHNNLIQSNVLVRKHNNKQCIKLMEDWWYYIKNYSKRDQVSFNYLIWKNKLSYATIKWDNFNNKYIFVDYKHKK